MRQSSKYILGGLCILAAQTAFIAIFGWPQRMGHASPQAIGLFAAGFVCIGYGVFLRRAGASAITRWQKQPESSRGESVNHRKARIESPDDTALTSKFVEFSPSSDAGRYVIDPVSKMMLMISSGWDRDQDGHDPYELHARHNPNFTLPPKYRLDLRDWSNVLTLLFSGKGSWKFERPGEFALKCSQRNFTDCAAIIRLSRIPDISAHPERFLVLMMEQVLEFPFWDQRVKTLNAQPGYQGQPMNRITLLIRHSLADQIESWTGMPLEKADDEYCLFASRSLA